MQVARGGNTEAAVGVLHIKGPDDDSAGIAYGVMTHGSADGAVTLGVGYSYRGGRHVDGGARLVMVSGEKRVSRRVSVDLGLGAPFAGPNVYFVPVIRFARRL